MDACQPTPENPETWVLGANDGESMRVKNRQRDGTFLRCLLPNLEAYRRTVNHPRCALALASTFACLVMSACDAKQAASDDPREAAPSAVGASAHTGDAEITPPPPSGGPSLPTQAFCARIDGAAVEAIFTKTPDTSFSVVEDTASGQRLRCEWQRGPIASMRISIYATPEFWNTVVQDTDEQSNYPESFDAWAAAQPDAPEASAARRGVPPTGFAFKATNGATVDISVVGRKDVTDEQLVGVALAVQAQL